MLFPKILPFKADTIIGKLQWLANGTRAEIAYAVSALSANQRRNNDMIYTAIRILIRYLASTIDYGINHTPTDAIPNKDTFLTSWPDSYFAINISTKKSLNAYSVQH